MKKIPNDSQWKDLATRVKTAKQTADSKSAITMTGADPGEGSALAAGSYVAVYGTSAGKILSSDLASDAVTTAKIDNQAVTAEKLADGAIDTTKLNWRFMAMPIMAFSCPITRKTYNNAYLAWDNSVMYFQLPGCGLGMIGTVTEWELTFPEAGSKYVVDVQTDLWTGSNSNDYLLLNQQISTDGGSNYKTFSRAMAPKVSGSWGFVTTRGMYTVNGKSCKLRVYLNTGGTNFSDGNLSDTDSKMLCTVYRVG